MSAGLVVEVAECGECGKRIVIVSREGCIIGYRVLGCSATHGRGWRPLPESDPLYPQAVAEWERMLAARGEP